MPLLRAAVIAYALLITGCSTTQEITLGKATGEKKLASVAQVLDDDNSAQMNGYLASALQKEGLNVKQSLPKGTRTTPDADALISYVDVWRWDIAMYMQDLTVRLHDAQTGDLLALGQWSDSPLHAFRDAKAVMQGLVSEMLAKVQGLKK